MNGSNSREVSFKVIASIIEARVAEIVEAIMYEIERSGFQDKLHSGIVLTGGGSQLAHICNYVTYKTGYSTRIASPQNNITFDSPEEVNKPSSSTAVGLLIYGCEKAIEREEELEMGNVMVDNTLFPEEVLETATVTVERPDPKRPKKPAREKRKSIFDMIGTFFDSANNEA